MHWRRVPVPIIARNPVPLDRGRLSIAHLPDNVIFSILGFLQQASAGDILTVASLCSSLYAQARYVQHRIVHIDLGGAKRAHDRLDLVIRCDLLPAIRMLKVTGINRCREELQEDSKEIITRLVDMLPGMTGLRDFEWKVAYMTIVPIPLSILESLPLELRLHTSLICSEDNDGKSSAQGREFLARLENNQNLFSLSIHVRFWTEPWCLEVMCALKKVLLSCPNLRRLPLIDVWYPRGPCFGEEPLFGAPYCGLGLSDDERPPELEELGVPYYPWGSDKPSTITSFNCLGYPEKGTEMEYWAEAFDWSRLHRLNDIPSDLACLIAPKLTRLKEFVLDGGGWETRGIPWDMTVFLHKIASSLELLSIPSWNYVGNKPDPIMRHGSELRCLKIHEVSDGWKVISYVTHQDLAQLCNGLPHLEELTIDIAREENDWPYKALDAIAKFPSLRTVELWFELGDASQPPAPFLTFSSARHLFSYLHERSKSIQRLILHSGAPSIIKDWPWWEQRGNPMMMLSKNWVWNEQNIISLVCNMVYDGDSGESFIDVSSPSLSRESNVRLHRLARGGGDRIVTSELDAKEMSLKIALDGPLTMDEWNALWHAYHVQTSSRRWKYIIRPIKRMSSSDSLLRVVTHLLRYSP